MYPTVVIVLISLQRSMEHTLQWQTSAANSWSVEDMIKDTVVSGQIQFSGSASMYPGSVSEEEMVIDLEAEAIVESEHVHTCRTSNFDNVSCHSIV